MTLPPPDTAPILPPAPAAPPLPPDPTPWQRLHPATPWLRGWAIIVVLAGFILREAQDNLTQLMEVGRWAGIGGIAAVIGGVLLLATAYNLVWWRRARYRVGAEAVDLHMGVLVRQQRRLRLDQLDAVDIVHPLVARLFGLVELRLQTAGGSQSFLSLKYLTAARAEAVRAEVLSHRPGATAEGGPGEPPPAMAFRVPPAWTVRSYFRTPTPWLTLLMTGGVIATSVATGTWTGLFGTLPFLFGFVQVFWKYIVTEMGFTGYVSPDGVALTHGLTTTIHQSIPAARIQAVRLQQRLWWRGPDWWRIDLNVAGYGPGDTANRTVLVTVADPTMAAIALGTVMPTLTRPDIWATVLEAMYGMGPAPGFTTTPRSARRFDPLTWRRQGYARTPYGLVLRTGRLTRTVTVVPYDRIQGLGVSAGPWDRPRGLAQVLVHSTRGPVVAMLPHVAAADAARLLAAMDADWPEPGHPQ